MPFLKPPNPCRVVWRPEDIPARKHCSRCIRPVDHEHIFALVEAVHGAHLDAVHRFAPNAALIDDVGQFSTPKIP